MRCRRAIVLEKNALYGIQILFGLFIYDKECLALNCAKFTKLPQLRVTGVVISQRCLSNVQTAKGIRQQNFLVAPELCQCGAWRTHHP